MFTGRIGAADYWKATLVYVVCSIGLLVLGLALSFAILFAVTAFATPASMGSLLLWVVIAPLVGWIPSFIGSIYLAAASIGLQVRRFHDLNVTGWAVGLFWLVGILTSTFCRTGPGPYDISPWAIAVSLVGVTAWIAISF
ncbi:MAG: DUF805 domain-containing protein, partial [Patescibacteria group bacterium]